MRWTRLIIVTSAVAWLAVQPAFAGCYADYKAKLDDPLRLHYGVVQLDDSACQSKSAAGKAIAKKISRDNWKLLSVISLFDESGLKERKRSAGAYYLKY